MNKAPIYDIAVRWPDGNRSLQRIKKLRGVPLHGRPHYLKEPDGCVAIVQSGGVISLLFRVKSIEGPCKVRLANGKHLNSGYLVRAKHGSMKQPTGSQPREIGIKWYAEGQFRYFDAKSARPIIVGDIIRGGQRKYIPDEFEGYHGVHYAKPYTGGIPGLPSNHPEARLVAQYVDWMNRPSSFEHPYLQSGRLYTDLFDRRYWRLIEAKAEIDRFTLRTAVGQLLDYKRFFPRKPSLGVLLPARPSQSSLEYLAECRVTAIWLTPRGRFGDSSENNLWSARET